MTAPRFAFWLFFVTLLLVLGLAGAINYLIDPLWYAQGNRLTGRNFVFNERIAKINLFDRTVDDLGYDCLILGSSRVTGLHPSRFEGLRCFNFALKGAEAPEQLAYARHAAQAGLAPKLLVVAVDDFNFVVKVETARRADPKVAGTPGPWHAFFSSDVLTFSMLTLAGIGPDRDYYDRNFELQRLREAPPFEPVVRDQSDLECSEARVAQFARIRSLFPQARAVAYAPLRSPWSLLNDLYLRGVLACTLSAYHRVAQDYDAFLDFGIPSPITRDNRLTDDGAHFSPAANDAVVDRLQERRSDLAIDAKSLSLPAYEARVRRSLYEFMQQEQLLSHWRGEPPGASATQGRDTSGAAL